MNMKVKIDSIAFGGYGVARVDGKVLFIPYTVTGDEVWIEVTEEKKRYSIGKVVRMIKPSPWRIDPPCPYFGICGGCQWQHIDPSIHGEMKQAILIETLKRLGKLDQMPLVDVVPFPKPYGYRVRVQLRVKEKAMGYYQERSHRIVDITHCPISHPLANQIISILRDQRDHFPSIEEIEINVSPQEEKGILIFHPYPSRSNDQRLEHFAKQFLPHPYPPPRWGREREGVSQPVLQGIAISGKREWTSLGNPSLSFTVPFPDGEKERNLSFRISPGSFSQVNLEQNEKLIQTVVEFSSTIKAERVLDLYAGAGNFTLPLAIRAGEVWGIEGNKVAIKDGQFNAERNGIQNARFIEGEVEEVLKDWNKGRPDQIILDPPRAGCKKIIDLIAGLKPKKIVYVSCEPTTFSRDLGLFYEKGYSLQRVRLIDMFPQTYHMEVVGLLTQN
ncbi:MAG: 23S rRNA (uracil(1939)-C(5))-methyltransferase RlmD [Deltaproteobacteria bacterium]|nr:23S rRNA (uracil(1939)-C(5))-methyltransferase RlmD [Deltaproteobacteria bacterium]